jgi:hypothetical protein
LLSYVAVLTQDEGLADSVAPFSMEKVRELKVDESTMEMICRLVECSSAYAHGARALETLARRLEAISFLAKPFVIAHLFDSLSQIQLVEGNAVGVSRTCLGRRTAR